MSTIFIFSRNLKHEVKVQRFQEKLIKNIFLFSQAMNTGTLFLRWYVSVFVCLRADLQSVACSVSFCRRAQCTVGYQMGYPQPLAAIST